MNILIIGFGSVGRHYLNLLKKFKNIKKIYLIDVIKHSKLQNFKQIELRNIKEKKIDYAIVCTPSNLHFKYAEFLVKNKINTLIEKPFVLSIKHAKRLSYLTKKNKVKCWVAFQNRQNFATLRGKYVLRKKIFGNPFFIDCALYWHRDKKYYSTGWRGKYRSDGGVLFNQSIHLLDMLIYFFGPIKKFNVLAGFSKDKLEAEDLISINFQHKNKVVSNLKATTRANKDYRMSMDVLCKKGRFLIKGISLNEIFYFTPKHIRKDKKNSEFFKLGLGPRSGMGNGHQKILKEFFNPNIKQSSCNLDINKNIYVIKLIHSIYNSIFKEKNFSTVNDKEFNKIIK
ncbi:MAG: hypothetical protein CMI79_03300 [Candidatus Pelagibacter sp.]|nr:hypothetical protein [Candidatus Pelagibacter sp.]